MTKFYLAKISSDELKAIKRAVDMLIYTSQDEDERLEAERIADHYDAFIVRNNIKLKPKEIHRG